jgi:signal peptidase I
MHTFFKITIIGLLIGLGIKIFALESFTVPTDSMTPTIAVGQRVWLNKLPFTPKLEDVIGFERNGEDYVKRIVGMPSDSVYTDGTSRDSREGRYFQIYKNKRFASNAPLTFMHIPKRGEMIALDADNYDFYQPLIEKEGNQIGKLLDKIYINGSETMSYTFTQNYYFVQGDNTEASIDSRQFGLIGEKSILGRLIGLK